MSENSYGKIHGLLCFSADFRVCRYQVTALLRKIRDNLSWLSRLLLKELNCITIMKANYSSNRWRVVITLLLPLSIAAFSLAAPSSLTAQTCGWNIVSSPNTTSPTNFLSDVSIIAGNDIWA